jgi:imidazoleglycerol-phosphate dehydratase
MQNRRATIERRTSETQIEIALAIDPSLDSSLEGKEGRRIATGLGFLDHMLGSFARHGRFEMSLTCRGDLYIDDHHTVEDCAIVLGEAFDRALGERRGIERFGDAIVVMDEAMARAAVDLSGRGFACIDLGLRRETLGDVACENLSHFFRSFANASRNTVHIDVLRGENDHHRAEASFKALAVALRRAVARTGSNIVPSTKGVLA